jgi:hypothetical protein
MRTFFELPIFQHRRHVDGRDGLGKVHGAAKGIADVAGPLGQHLRPAAIEQHVLELVARAEVDAVLRGFVVLAVGPLPAFHQSHMVLPGLIQEVSPMALGGFN